MILLLYIAGVYLSGIVAMLLWDAYIGFGFDFDGNDYPPFGLALIFWPLAFPIAFFIGFAGKLEGVKRKRIDKAKAQKRLRIAAEKETADLLDELEKEIKQKEVS
jgi:hypothetical protein